MTKILTREEWLTYLDTTWKKCLADAWQEEWDDMNREEITRMAREARGYPAAPTDGSLWLFSESHLERFAALVAAAEREACAALVDENAMGCENPVYRSLLQSNAAAIRARGKA